MPLTRDDLRRLAAVAHARGLGFVELVGLAELDPATAFRGAVIQGADLRGQDLAGFDFSGAIFVRCDLTGADLSRTTGVTARMLDGAIHDRATRLPSRLRAAFWSGAPPVWAEDWGRDRHGKWVSFRISVTRSRSACAGFPRAVSRWARRGGNPAGSMAKARAMW